MRFKSGRISSLTVYSYAGFLSCRIEISARQARYRTGFNIRFFSLRSRNIAGVAQWQSSRFASGVLLAVSFSNLRDLASLREILGSETASGEGAKTQRDRRVK